MSSPSTLLAEGPRTELFEELAPTVTGAFLALARELEDCHESLAQTSLRRLHDDDSSADGTAADYTAEAMSTFIRATLRAQLSGLRRGILPADYSALDAAGIRAFAKAGELRQLTSACRMLQRILWEAWFELVDRAPASAATRNELLGFGAEFFSSYAHLLSDFATDVYRGELGRVSEDAEGRRLRAIGAVLDGDAQTDLDLDLDQHHLGFLAWGEDPGAAARELAKALGRQLFSVNPPSAEECCWAWISARRPLGPGEERQLAGFRPARARVALGLAGYGVSGFCASHRQALRARRLADPGGPALLRYEDIAVEALALENEEDARAFIAHELRGIDDETAASRRIRETLATYFAAECSAVSAGAALGVHEQTVASRLRRAEQRLGLESIGARRVELELALRLRTHLASSL